jgi:hypothetical protein
MARAKGATGAGAGGRPDGVLERYGLARFVTSWVSRISDSNNWHGYGARSYRTNEICASYLCTEQARVCNCAVLVSYVMMRFVCGR